MKTDRMATKPVRLIRWWLSLGAHFCRHGTDFSLFQSSNTVEILPALSEVSCMAQCQTPGSEKQICVFIQQSTAVSPGLTVLFIVKLKTRCRCPIPWNMSSKCQNKSLKLLHQHKCEIWQLQLIQLLQQQIIATGSQLLRRKIWQAEGGWGFCLLYI